MRCYWCGKPVSDNEVVMLNVILGLGRSYARTGRRRFHKACAAEARAKCRRSASLTLLVTAIVAVGLLMWTREAVFPIVAVILGSLLAFVTFSSYS